MKASRLIPGIIAAFAIHGCAPDAADAPDATETAGSPAPAAGPFNEAAVWNGPLDRCRAGAPGEIDSCMIETMTAGGATPEALAATEWLLAQGNPGHVSAWRMEGPIGIATVTYPFRANTNEGQWLAPPAGDPIDVDTPPPGFESLPAWQSFASANPGAAPFAPAVFDRREAEAEGDRLIFTMPLRDCHACADLGQLQTAYRFGADGALMESGVIGVE